MFDGGPIGRVTLTLHPSHAPVPLVFAIVHVHEQVISNDPAPIGQPVAYARQGGRGEDVLHCIQNKATVNVPAAH